MVMCSVTLPQHDEGDNEVDRMMKQRKDENLEVGAD